MPKVHALFAAAILLASATAFSAPVSFGNNQYTFIEGSGTGTITVIREVAIGLPLTLNYSWKYAGPSSASFPHDSGTLTFGAQESSKTIDITIPNDNVYTWWYHASYDGAHLAGALKVSTLDGKDSSTVVFTVLDDDPLPVVGGPAEITIPEGDSGTTAIPVHFTLSAPFVIDEPFFSVGYVTAGGTADASDVSITNSGGPLDYIINVKGDFTAERDEIAIVTFHLGPASTLDIGHYDVRVHILNDDYNLDTPTPPIERGTTGAITLSTSVPSASTDHFTLTSSNPAAATVPAFVDVPAGSMIASMPVTGVAAGFATISVTLPPSRGSATFTTDVTVFQTSTLIFDRPAMTMSLGSLATVAAHLDPPPESLVSLVINNSRPSVVETPFTLRLDSAGQATFPVRALGIGTSTLSMTLPPEYGNSVATLRVDVTQPTGLAITSLSATSGPATGNQPVTLFGNDIKGRCTVTFDGVAALNTAVAANGSVSTFTPAHPAGKVHVGIRCGTREFTLADGYTYVAAPPHLTRIAPATGSVDGGTIVTAGGENLPRGRCSLWFGDAPATTLVNLQATEMTAIAPAHAAGAVAVTLRCDGNPSTLNDVFVFTGQEPPAEIAAVIPSAAAPGERVTINGSRFRVGDAISFGGTAGIGMTTAPDQHVITVPEVAGQLTITLRDADGRSVTAPFTVAAPAATQLVSAPAKVTIGAEFVVNGAGFRPSHSFVLGGATLPAVVVAPAFAILRVPQTMQPQATTFAVKDGSGAQVASRPMEAVASGVAVESVTPQCVSTEGGPLVTIKGRGFEPGAVVTFGIADGTEVVARDANTIIARAPASSGVREATVTVTNPSLDSGQLTNTFQYRWPASQCGASKHRAISSRAH